MLSAIIALTVLAVVFGLLLGFASVRFKVDSDPIVDKIDAILPQTQCGQCGFPGCRPYAEAIASGDADINCCPPGGDTVILALSDLLGVDPKPLDCSERAEKQVAWVDENTCIGCTLCLQACPVDAILGAAKQLHFILESECTGCKLCIEPCPVDCIYMRPVKSDLNSWKWPYPANVEGQV